jgi:hypothetical protein
MGYNIDRSLLESKTTEEIMRILKKERDDYTPEAIELFEEILAQRGVGGGETTAISSGTSSVRFSAAVGSAVY